MAYEIQGVSCMSLEILNGRHFVVGEPFETRFPAMNCTQLVLNTLYPGAGGSPAAGTTRAQYT